jgi:hypothetical protein
VTPDGAHFVGRHRGFRRLPGGADFHRNIRFEAGARRWTVTDELPLRGQHQLEWRWHLHPNVAAEFRDGVWHLRHENAHVTLACPGDRPPRGELATARFAPSYGRQTDTRVLVFQAARDGPVREAFVLQRLDPP